MSRRLTAMMARGYVAADEVWCVGVAKRTEKQANIAPTPPLPIHAA